MAQLKDLIVSGPARIIGDLYSSNIYATTFSGALSGTASNTIYASSAGYAQYGGTATHAKGSYTSSYAASAGYAQYGGTATHAKGAYTAVYASSASYANISGSATHAKGAYTAVYASSAGYANIAGTSTYAISSGSAGYAGSVTWGNVSNKTDATTAVSGLMSGSDKIKLLGLHNSTAYCDTAAATAAKVASCDGYTLTAGTYIHILMVNANSAASAITLNINGKGAKTIYIDGAVSSSTNKTLPAGTYLIYYDGTYYYFRTDGLLPGKAQTIDGVTLTGQENPIHYGSCGTAGNTAAKVVNCTGFTLITGSRIVVNFQNENTAENPTLNVNSTGAKSLYSLGVALSASSIKANSFLEFVYDGTNYQLVGGAGGNSSIKVFASPHTSTAAYYIIGQAGTDESSSDLYKAAGATTANGFGIYYTPRDRVLFGAAWNDYAEFRRPKEKNIEAGRVVKENGDGTLSITTSRLERGCEIVSDTFGFGIGKNDEATLPVATSGRVLAYPDKNPSSFTIGAPVCSGPEGTVSEMTEIEESKYPSRIIGTVSEIPDYKIWHGANDVEVNGRIWIRIR